MQEHNRLVLTAGVQQGDPRPAALTSPLTAVKMLPIHTNTCAYDTVEHFCYHLGKQKERKSLIHSTLGHLLLCLVIFLSTLLPSVCITSLMPREKNGHCCIIMYHLYRCLSFFYSPSFSLFFFISNSGHTFATSVSSYRVGKM